jgi:hypothetical protein
MEADDDPIIRLAALTPRDKGIYCVSSPQWQSAKCPLLFDFFCLGKSKPLTLARW